MTVHHSLGISVPFLGYLLLFVGSAILCVFGVFRARYIPAPDVRRGLIALLVTTGGWATAHVGYLAAPSPDLQYAFFVAGLVVGLSAVGPWLYFCSAYTGRTLHRHRTVRWKAVGLYGLLVTAKVTNPLHHLYFTTELVSAPFPYLLIQHQPLHWVVMGLAYALALLGVFMLFERFARVGYDTTPLAGLVALTALPVVFDVFGAVTPYLLDITYSPVGVAAFAVGSLYFYFDRFETVRLAGPTDSPVIVLDDDARIHEYNQAARELFPALTDAITTPLAEALPELADVLDTADPVIERERDGTTRYYSVTTAPFTADQTARGRLLTLTDVTEREQYRDALEQTNDRLEQFASIVSHDLRNPLNIAQGRLDLAMETGESEHLDHIERAHDRMATLIDDLLTLAHEGQTVGEFESVALEPLVDGCWQTVDAPGATLVVETEQTIRADRSRLQQLVENLLRNAIDHGGDDVTVTVGDIANGFFVADDGSGIPEGERDAVFDFGYSTAEEGTGFGLAIVKEIVEAHGWAIRVTDGAEAGTRFEITGVESGADETGSECQSTMVAGGE